MRRFALLSTTILAASALSSCGTARSDDTVAKLGEQTLTRDTLSSITRESTDGNAIRIAITNWLHIAALGGDMSAVETLEDLQALGEQTIGAIAQGLETEARTAYESGLNGSPLLCLAVIPANPPTTADDIIAEIAAGLPFVDAITKYAGDETLIARGGKVVDQSGNECLAPGSLNAALLASMVEAEATVGTPVAVVFQDLEFVVLLRPFDDLTAGDREMLAGPAVTDAVRRLLSDAAPHVNSRYGAWDSSTQSVVALSER